MKKLFLGLIVALFSFQVFAQSKPLILIGGSNTESSMYSAMAREIIGTCRAEVAAASGYTLTQGFSTGTVDTFGKMRAKAGWVAFAQDDIRQLYMNNEKASMAGFLPLMGLNHEAYHFIGPASVKDGWFGKKAPQLVEDLSGMTIAVTETGMLSLRWYMHLTGIALNPVQFADSDAAIDAVKTGKAAAALIVTSRDNPAIEQMGKKTGGSLKLLGLSKAHADKLKAAGYLIESLSYPGLGMAVTAWTRVVLMAQNFNAPDRRSGISALRKCISDNLPELIDEATFTSAAWRGVDLKAPIKAEELWK